MTDWKDITKELPNKDCEVLVRVATETNKNFDEDFDYYIITYEIAEKYFYNCENGVFFRNEFNYIVDAKKEGFRSSKLTHWAYINEPKEEK